MATANTWEIVQKLKGLNTLKMIESALNIDRSTAIYIVHKLRKKGFVKTKYTSDKKRVYYISPRNVLGGTSYTDTINEYSPLKIMETDQYYVYGKEITAEEALIYAITKKSVRYIIASLSLFRKIDNWSELYKKAKEKNLLREIAALYEVARRVIPKIRKMPKRFKNLAMPKKTDRFKYILDGFRSVNFKDIEKKWKVYVPLNFEDLVDYRGEFS